MKSIADRAILGLFGGIMIYMMNGREHDVFYLLCGCLAMGTLSYLDERSAGKYEWIVDVCGILAAVPIPLFLPYAGMFIYSFVYRYQRKWSVRVGILAAVFVTGCVVWERKKLDAWCLLIGMISLLAVYMAVRTRELVNREREIMTLRDDSTEKNNYLKERNQELVENQSNEIYIATLKERNRIAREIHDNVGHMLSRSILQVGALMAINKEEPMHGQLEILRESLDTAMNNIRESVHDLHKESFDIKEAAGQLLKDLVRFEVKFDCDISMDADKDMKYAFLTILKEAITNINKYSNGKKVMVVMRELDEYYQMLIEDDGNSAGNSRGVNAGIGLTNMEERVRALNGVITFSEERGFRIFISVPKKEDTNHWK